ncbi:hypothetical protein X778_18795 [Pseudomonas aeruginosa VRFPA07]|nr:hypothetical protein X778_18795 [Pseudomonas aeruginosa VRFPA07]
MLIMPSVTFSYYRFIFIFYIIFLMRSVFF